MTTNEVLRVENVGHSYGSNEVLRDVSLSLSRGEYLSIVGPSGAGKSTLLQCLSGLQVPSKGRVIFEGEHIKSPPKDMTVVFQDYSRSLMPWMSVLGNVTLPLRSRGTSKAERRAKGLQALSDVGLDGAETKFPWQLSGGMQQRVAIARALVCDPAVVVMDEPFGSVDAQTRADLEDLVREVGQRLGVTVVLVTHDIDEAVYVADKVLVLSGAPATVSALIPVPLGNNRDQVKTKMEPEFAKLRGEVYELIQQAKSRSSSVAAGG